MTIGELQVILTLATRKFIAGLRKARSALMRFKGMIGGLGSMVGKIAGVAFNILRKAILATGIALVGATIAGARFEDAMTRTFAIVSGGSQMAEEDMRALTDEARRLGRETLYSSTQAAKGMEVLALAGMKVGEIVEAIGPTLELAIVGNMDLAETTGIVTAGLKSYGMVASEATRLTDILAAAATSANITVSTVGEAFKYVGAMGRGAGVKLEELVAIIGLLGNAGIQGSMAGTSLRRAIASMLAPTGKAKSIMKKLGITFIDTTGNLRPLVDIIGDLRKAGITTSEIMEMFGLRAGPSFVALIRMGEGALLELTKTLEGSAGTAHRVAEKFRTTLIGRTKDLIASLNELSITIFNTFKAPLKAAVFAIRNWVLKIQEAIESSGVLKAVVEGLIEGSSMLREKIKGLSDKFVEWIETLDAEKVKEFWESFTSKIVGAINKIIEFIKTMRNAWDVIRRGGRNAGEIFKQVGKIITAAFKLALTQIMNAVWTIGRILWEPIELGFTLLVNKLVNEFRRAMLEMQREIAKTRFGRIMGIKPPAPTAMAAMRAEEKVAAETTRVAWEQASADIGKAIKEGFETGAVSIKEFKNEITSAIMEINKLVRLAPVVGIPAETAVEKQKEIVSKIIIGQKAVYEELARLREGVRGIVFGRPGEVGIPTLTGAAEKALAQVGGTARGADTAVSNITRILGQISEKDGYTRKKVDELANIETIGGITGETQVDAY